VYVHWPYCRRNCNYCNFNKYLLNGADSDRMVACLVREWDTVKTQEGITKAKTVFFGGGTPSLMRPNDVEKVLRTVKII
jgi:oxygen-independent coproporphyrinogen-3 oxidase